MPLNNSGLRNQLEDLVLGNGIPVLGVCVGLQIMSRGREEGELSGLGWLDADVKILPKVQNLPLPHMGFNLVKAP